MNRRDFIAMAPAFPAATIAATLTLREDGKEPVDLDVSVLKVEPGDIVVLKATQYISQEGAEYVKAYLEDRVFPGCKALVLTGGLSVQGVLRTNE